MPLRSVKMKRFIFGFQRRVWCPKWTPLSSSWRMVTTAMAFVSLSLVTRARCRAVARLSAAAGAVARVVSVVAGDGCCPALTPGASGLHPVVSRTGLRDAARGDPPACVLPGAVRLDERAKSTRVHGLPPAILDEIRAAPNREPAGSRPQPADPGPSSTGRGDGRRYRRPAAGPSQAWLAPVHRPSASLARPSCSPAAARRSLAPSRPAAAAPTGPPGARGLAAAPAARGGRRLRPARDAGGARGHRGVDLRRAPSASRSAPRSPGRVTLRRHGSPGAASWWSTTARPGRPTSRSTAVGARSATRWPPGAVIGTAGAVRHPLPARGLPALGAGRGRALPRPAHPGRRRAGPAAAAVGGCRRPAAPAAAPVPRLPALRGRSCGRRRSCGRSGPGVGLPVGLPQPVGGDVGVDLRGRQRGVAEQLLDACAGRRRPRAGGWRRCAAGRAARGRAHRARRRAGRAPACAPPAGRSARRGPRGTAPAPEPGHGQRRGGPAQPGVQGPLGGHAVRARCAPCGPCRAPARPGARGRRRRRRGRTARRPGCRWRRAARGSPRRAARPGCRRRRCSAAASSSGRASSDPQRRRQRAVRLGRAEQRRPGRSAVRPVRCSPGGEHPDRGGPARHRGARLAEGLLLWPASCAASRRSSVSRSACPSGAACSSMPAMSPR